MSGVRFINIRLTGAHTNRQIGVYSPLSNNLPVSIIIQASFTSLEIHIIAYISLSEGKHFNIPVNACRRVEYLYLGGSVQGWLSL